VIFANKKSLKEIARELQESTFVGICFEAGILGAVSNLERDRCGGEASQIYL
jgi:hypothetical protein